MRIFGLEITRAKAAPSAGALVPATNAMTTFLGAIRESFAGAWQRGVVVDDRQSLLAFSAVYSCVTMIASDIAKLDLELRRKTSRGYQEVENSPFLQVLRKPNRFQNRQQFLQQWIISRLLYGNAYMLKERDGRGIVTALYVLEPSRVTPLVGSDGSVWYRLSNDMLAQVERTIDVPASEIIHDMEPALWHPLVGVSPIYACGSSATLGNKIASNSAKFFENMSRPSGLLTAPGVINDVTAARLKEYWEKNYSGENIGRLAVLGDGLKYEAMTIPAQDAQLIEQLRWTVEDVARCFHVPLYMLMAGDMPTYNNIEALQQMYFQQALQSRMESIELTLEEGLQLPSDMEIEFDEDDMLRMDTSTRYEAYEKAIKAGWMSPNEARAKEDLPPVEGGESCYLQQQNYSLAALARRDAQAPAPSQDAPGAPAPTGAQNAGGEADDSPDAGEQVRDLMAYLKRAFDAELAA